MYKRQGVDGPVQQRIVFGFHPDFFFSGYSRIVAVSYTHLIKGAVWYDSRNFIKTEKKHAKHILDSELTTSLVKETFDEIPQVALAVSYTHLSLIACSGNARSWNSCIISFLFIVGHEFLAII